MLNKKVTCFRAQREMARHSRMDTMRFLATGTAVVVRQQISRPAETAESADGDSETITTTAFSFLFISHDDLATLQ
jgi:hypothetical protein